MIFIRNRNHDRDYDLAHKPDVSKAMLLRIASFFKPYIGFLAISLVAILIVSSLELVPSLLLQKIVDVALPSKSVPQLIQWVLLSVGATIALSLLQVGQSTLNITISKSIVSRMKNKMYRHLQKMSQNFFSTEKPGEIVTRMGSDIDGIQDVFHTTFVSLFTALFTLGTTLALLFTMNWKLALLSLATVPLFVLPTKSVGKKRWQITKERQVKSGELSQIIQETLSISGSTLTKLFAAEKIEADEFDRTNGEVIALQKKEELTGRWYRMTMNVLSSVGPLLVYLFGGILCIRGELSIGGVLTFATLLGRLYRPVMQLSNLHIDSLRSLALFERIFQYFDKPIEIADETDAQELQVSDGTIRFDHVSFTYPEADHTLLDMTFTAKGGETLALVGSSGAGKTTITNLIPRLYDVLSGSVSIDGQDVRNISLESLRSQIGIVTQEPYLFNGTIRENLTYGCNNIGEEEMISAAKAAYIHDFISTLPDGYETIVGNRGIKLSGGEKQRISIARVILKNPKLLILDEATSALDSISEYYVQKAMEPLMKGRTSIVIAHRLSTIQNADQILVIDQGTLVESGKHSVLMARKGSYYQLHQRQFAIAS